MERHNEVQRINIEEYKQQIAHESMESILVPGRLAKVSSLVHVDILNFIHGPCSFSALVARSTDLKEQMNFVYKLPLKSKKEERQSVRAWRLKESNKILSSYSSFDIEDIMFVIHTAGIQAFSRTLVFILL